MNQHDELIELERAAWQALSTEGAAAPYYEKTLAGTVLMLLPGGLVVDERVLDLTPDSAVVAYRVEATREDMDYEALLNSTYVREDGEWKLALHQQTPL